MSKRHELASRILTGGTSLVVAQGLTMIIYFLAQRMILSTLTKEANGVMFAERRIVDLVVIMLVDFGMNIIAMRRMVQDPDRAGIILSSAVAYRIALWLPFTGICLLYAQFAGLSLLDVMLWSCYVFISSRTGLLRFSYETPYRFRMSFGLPALLFMADAVLFLGIIFAWQDRLSPTTVILASLLSAIPGFLIMVALDRGRMINPRLVERAEVKELFREALPVITAVIFLGVHDKIDALMLDWISTPLELGIFGAGMTSLSPILTTIPISVAMTMAPAIARLAKDDYELSKRYSMTALRILIVSGVVLCALVSPLTPFIIELVSKGRYADNELHFFLFLWMPIPIFILAFVQDVLNAYSQQRRYVPVAVALALVTVVGGLLLIPSMNAMGAIIAKLTSVSAGAALALYTFRRILNEGITLKFVASVVALTAIAVATSVLLPKAMPMWFAAITSGLIVTGMAFLLGLLRMRDITLIRDILGSSRRRNNV